jgi:hypothetical protein
VTPAKPIFASLEHAPARTARLDDLVQPQFRIIGEDATTPAKTYDEGVTDGVEAARTELAAAFAALDECRRKLDEDAAVLEAYYRRQFTETLASIITAAAPTICEASARAELKKLFEPGTPPAEREQLSFAASPDLFERLKDSLPDEAARGAFIADPDLEPGKFIARWPGGGFDCDAASSLFAIVRILDPEADNAKEDVTP